MICKEKMTWKETLRKLEQRKEWDIAIEFMQDMIHEYPNDIDAYLYMNYLLMNILNNEKYDPDKFEEYEVLIQHCLNESYVKYSENAEFLFYTSQIVFLSKMFLGIFLQDAKNMLQRATEIEPNNPVYQIANISERCYIDFEERKRSKPFAKLILEENSPIKAQLQKKGALGEHILSIITEWANDMITDKYLYEQQ